MPLFRIIWFECLSVSVTWVGLKASETSYKSQSLRCGSGPTVTFKRAADIYFLNGKLDYKELPHSLLSLGHGCRNGQIQHLEQPRGISFAKFLAGLFLQIHPQGHPEVRSMQPTSSTCWQAKVSSQTPNAAPHFSQTFIRTALAVLTDRVALWKAHYSKWKDKVCPKPRLPKTANHSHFSKIQQTEEPQMKGKKEGMITEGKDRASRHHRPSQQRPA